jgi:hypothetical protein
MEHSASNDAAPSPHWFFLLMASLEKSHSRIQTLSFITCSQMEALVLRSLWLRSFAPLDCPTSIFQSLSPIWSQSDPPIPSPYLGFRHWVRSLPNVISRSHPIPLFPSQSEPYPTNFNSISLTLHILFLLQFTVDNFIYIAFSTVQVSSETPTSAWTRSYPEWQQLWPIGDGFPTIVSLWLHVRFSSSLNGKPQQSML